MEKIQEGNVDQEDPKGTKLAGRHNGGSSKAAATILFTRRDRTKVDIVTLGWVMNHVEYVTEHQRSGRQSKVMYTLTNQLKHSPTCLILT